MKNAFFLLLAVRIFACLVSPIPDCDGRQAFSCMRFIKLGSETFNYWEPTHFLIYGNGLQTWEYRWRISVHQPLTASLHLQPRLRLALVFVPSAARYCGQSRSADRR